MVGSLNNTSKGQEEVNFNMKAPCANCPFLKEGAIELSPGRLSGICEDLEKNDWESFQCHKTVHSHIGGEWVETDDGTDYIPSGKESHCMGAAAYLYKKGKTSVPMRLALTFGMLKVEDLEKVASKVIDEPEGKQKSAKREKRTPATR